MNSKRYILIFLIFTVLSACKQNITEKDKSVFRWNIHAGLTSLDPAFARNQANIWVTHQMFNGLVELNDELEVVPSIAHSWEINEMGTIYTFYLNNNVYFHDHDAFENSKGRKVTARDFVYSLNRILDPEVASPGAWIFHGTVKTKVVNGKTKGAFLAVNDSTLQIELIKAFPPFLGLLTMQYCSVVPQEVVDFYERDFRRNPVGTGPFKFFMWDEGNYVILHKNDNYFESENGHSLPYLDAVQISLVPGKQNEFYSFLRNELDMVSGIDASFKDNLLTKDGNKNPRFEGKFDMQKIPFLNTEYLGILVDSTQDALKNSPLKYKKIRQAINYSIDRERMIRFLRNNIGKAADAGFVPAGMSSYDPDAVMSYKYDPAKAAKLLEEAGYPGGIGLPLITLYTNESYLDLSTFIQNQLSELNIPVRLEVNPSSIHREWVSASQINFFRGSWIADYPDAENYLALFYSKNFTPAGPNYTRFSNAEFDKLYEKAQTITDDKERYKLYHQMENIMMEESPVIVLYYDEVVRLIHHNISGLNKNAINLICLKKVRKVGSGE